MQQSRIDRPTLPRRHPNGIRSDTECDTMTQTEAGYTPLIATNAITL